MAERLVLVGMMGAGKTTVGRLSAKRLGWEYSDSDAQVIEETGRTVPELFAEEGEEVFRAHESRVLSEALSGDRSMVVSAAGGVVLSEANRRLLRDSATVVWLRADVGTLADRVGAGRGAHSSTPTRPSRSPLSTRCAAPSTRRSPTRWWTSMCSNPRR